MKGHLSTHLPITWVLFCFCKLDLKNRSVAFPLTLSLLEAWHQWAQFLLKYIKVSYALGLDYSTNPIFLVVCPWPCCTVTHHSQTVSHIWFFRVWKLEVFLVLLTLQTYKPWWSLPLLSLPIHLSNSPWYIVSDCPAKAMHSLPYLHV